MDTSWKSSNAPPLNTYNSHGLKRKRKTKNLVLRRGKKFCTNYLTGYAKQNIICIVLSRKPFNQALKWYRRKSLLKNHIKTLFIGNSVICERLTEC